MEPIHTAWDLNLKLMSSFALDGNEQVLFGRVHRSHLLTCLLVIFDFKILQLLIYVSMCQAPSVTKAVQQNVAADEFFGIPACIGCCDVPKRDAAKEGVQAGSHGDPFAAAGLH